MKPLPRKWPGKEVIFLALAHMRFSGRAGTALHYMSLSRRDQKVEYAYLRDFYNEKYFNIKPIGKLQYDENTNITIV